MINLKGKEGFSQTCESLAKAFSIRILFPLAEARGY